MSKQNEKQARVRLGIAAQITFVVGCIALGVVLALLLLWGKSRDQFDAFFSEQLAMQADSLARNLADLGKSDAAFSLGDEVGMKATIDSMTLPTTWAYSAFVGVDGSVRASSSVENGTVTLETRLQGPPIPCSETIASSAVLVGEGGVSEVVAPIVFQDTMELLEGNGATLKGCAVVGLSHQSADEQFASIDEKVRRLAVVLVLVAGLLAFLLVNRMMRPLREIASLAHGIARGQFGRRSAYRGKDEVGLLSNSFNSMSESLEGMVQAVLGVARGQLTIPVTGEGELADALRSMIVQLHDLAERANAVADGDLSHEVEQQGDLPNAFNGMVRSLRQVTGEIDRTTAEIRRASGEILESVDHQKASASEQSAAIHETSAAVEEVRQMAEQMEGQAASVMEVSERSLEIGNAGRAAVDACVVTMQGIEEQVRSIAKSILELNAQTSQIADFVSMVNAIAEQSNLLSVNAAIEAAKAGEHGRGFAVVAAEVKNLADRSRESTAEIERILESLSTAMSGVVMVTEEGTKRAREGIDYVNVAGERLEELGGIIEESTQAARMIEGSARQQSSGMGQIAGAIGSLRDALADNLSRAEQSQSAARSLDALGKDLNLLMEHYRKTEG